MNDHRGFYSEEAAGYETKRYGSRYGRLFRMLQRAAVARGLLRSQRPEYVLDVATGTGQMLAVLASPGVMVVASDLTTAMLAEARVAYAKSTAIQYCVADATRLPYADGKFDVVASSRFLHLFDMRTQQSLLLEMARVLKPGGILIVDFYSADARRFFSLPVRLYRTLLQKRPENDYRVSITAARAMLETAKLRVIGVEGIGNFLLVPLLWLPLPTLTRLATWLGRRHPRLSEQFLVVARKQ